MKYTKQLQTRTYTQTPMKTVISIKRVIYQMKLALHYIYNLVLKNNFYII